MFFCDRFSQFVMILLEQLQKAEHHQARLGRRVVPHLTAAVFHGLDRLVNFSNTGECNFSLFSVMIGLKVSMICWMTKFSNDREFGSVLQTFSFFSIQLANDTHC